MIKINCGITWWEDADGNIIESNDACCHANGVYYWSCFPCRVSKDVSKYDYHPHGIYKILIKLPFISNRIKSKIGKTFNHLFSVNISLGIESQNTAVAMVNSGDYTLSEALYILANACERCTNVLDRKYQGEGHGYEEYSDEWKRCGTECDFCKVNA